MNELPSPQDGWNTCPPGALIQAVQHGQRRDRMNRVRPYLLTATLAVLALAVAVRQYSQRPVTDLEYAGIRCSTVVSLLEDLAANKLETAIKQQVEAHLQLCVACRSVQMRSAPQAVSDRVKPSISTLRLAFASLRRPPKYQNCPCEHAH